MTPSKFNLLFDVGGFFEAGDLDFIRLMIRVIYQDGCVQLRDMMYKLRVETTTNPFCSASLHEGVTDKLFFTRYPDNIARLILVMDNALNDELAGALGTERGGAETSWPLWICWAFIAAAWSACWTPPTAPYGWWGWSGWRR